MMNRSLMLFAVLSVMLLACNNKKQESQVPKELQSQSQQQMPSGHPEIGAGSSTSVAGVSWTLPSRWSEGPQKQMRVATYVVPAVSGDADGGECAVFFFGAGQGGDTQMNIDRWVGQFENAKGPDQSGKEVNGMKVTLVKIAGTYLAPGGPMMQSSGKHENYRLLGAIVAAPEGSVFFKFTGPAKTVASAESDFNSLVQSLTK